MDRLLPALGTSSVLESNKRPPEKRGDFFTFVIAAFSCIRLSSCDVMQFDISGLGVWHDLSASDNLVRIRRKCK